MKLWIFLSMPFMWVMILKRVTVGVIRVKVIAAFNALYVGDDFETSLLQD